MDRLAKTEDATLPGDAAANAPSPGLDYAAEPPRLLTKGETLGRYVVLRKLGAGAMGTVYLGYDPELDRKVALKMLRGTSNEARRKGLLREAQAMAKLRHRKVVAVHDVGEHEGQIYVAMEFIEGVTLSAWLKASPRGWREIIELFRHAGDGLAAAHERELIHRDFKPDNVMVTAIGHVMVMDFGLARASSDARDDESRDDEELDSISGSVLTEASVGPIAGTPVYMAPEQFRAEELGPAADQFAFCVSLWEALCGQRPFAGTSIGELYTAKSEGQIQPVPSGVSIPRWLEAIVRRGLEPEAERRWPSMVALLEAIRRGRRRWRWQAALAGLGVLGLVVAVAVNERLDDQRAQQAKVEACAAEAAAIDEIWNPAAREELEAGLLATGLEFARRSVETLVPWFDDYRDAWSRGREEVCVHATIDGDWDAERVDRATWCLEDRRLQLEATVHQIATLDRMGARRAVRLGSYLDPVETCLDPVAMHQLPVPPPELRDAIREVRAKLTEVDRLRYRGDYDAALAVAEQARTEAEGLDWPPLIANARFIEGRCQLQIGEFEAAREQLTQAYFEGLGSGSTEVAFRAARSLILVLSAEKRNREAKVWARHATVLGQSLHDIGGLDEAEGHYLLVSVYMGLSEHDAAIAAGHKASAMRAAVLGSDHPITAAAYRSLGMAYHAAGRSQQGLEYIERAAEIWEQTVGREHPYISEFAGIRGDALYELGRLDEALVQVQDCAEVATAVFEDESHPKLHLCLAPMALIYTDMGRLDEAEAIYERDFAVVEARPGARTPAMARALLSRSGLDLQRGDYALALERCAEALKILERSPEAGDVELAHARRYSADVYVAMGELDRAETELAAIVTLLEGIDGPESSHLLLPLLELGAVQRAADELDAAEATDSRALALALRVDSLETRIAAATGLAEVALAKGEPDEARSLANQAVELAVGEGLGFRLSAPAQWALARAEAAKGERPDRARTLAEDALRGFTALYDERRTEVEAWLAGAI